MKIDWTPWIGHNVSMHHRLEVLGVAFLIFCAYFVGSISSITIIYSLVISILIHYDFQGRFEGV